jgi:hypothetical protein
MGSAGVSCAVIVQRSPSMRTRVQLRSKRAVNSSPERSTTVVHQHRLMHPFAALAEPRRRAILSLVRDEPRPASDVARHSRRSPSRRCRCI